MLPKAERGADATVAGLAFRFVMLIGIVNFFADMTYEGGRSIIGPFLGSLGASAAIVGFVAGFGELVGYGLRSISGYLADKTHRYWFVTFTGYLINMLAVPSLALAGNWPAAAALIVAERAGRAIRRPAVEAMISHAGKPLGRGWVFGFNEALDQAGATIGPLIIAFVLYRRGGYHHAFAVLLISAVLCLITLWVARAVHKHPEELEEGSTQLTPATRFPRSYWLYVTAGALIAAGYADFALIAFHFQQTSTVLQLLSPFSTQSPWPPERSLPLWLGSCSIYSGFGRCWLQLLRQRSSRLSRFSVALVSHWSALRFGGWAWESKTPP
jgi:predicted MFS family arabinose efflux permease